MKYHDENEGTNVKLVSNSKRVLAPSSGNVFNPNSTAKTNMNKNEGTLQFPTVPEQFSVKAKQLQKVVEENPTQTSAWWFLVHFYSAKCKLDSFQMLEVCEKACLHVIEDKNDRGYAKLHLAQCKYLCQCQRIKEALRLYKAMAINGIGKDLHYFWIGYAVTLVKHNKRERAIHLLKKAIPRINSKDDQQKVQTYLKDLQSANLLPMETPKQPKINLPNETPQNLKISSKNHEILSTPAISNSFDSEISTPACLIEGTDIEIQKRKIQKLQALQQKQTTSNHSSKEISNESCATSPPHDTKDSEENNKNQNVEESKDEEFLPPEPKQKTEKQRTMEADVNFDDSDDEDEKNIEFPEFSINGKKYVKLGLMGKGGSARVIKALGWIGNGSQKRMELFAIKQVHISDEDSQSEALKNEVDYLIRLRGQKNIVHLFDHQLSSNRLSMVLELGDIDLRVLIRKLSNQKLKMNTIRVYWQQMLEAVSVIHEQRIVHADLKPANFVSFKGCLKLIDFGIAGAIQSNTTSIKRDTMVCFLSSFICFF